MFDALLLLQRGGVTVFNGALGANSGNLIRYFKDGGARDIFDGENPASYMLEAMGGGISMGGGGGSDKDKGKPGSPKPAAPLRGLSVLSEGSASAAGKALRGVASSRFFKRPSSEAASSNSAGASVQSLSELELSPTPIPTPAQMQASPPEAAAQSKSEAPEPAARPTIDFGTVYKASQLKELVDAAVDEALAKEGDADELSKLLEYPGGRQRAARLGTQFIATYLKTFRTYHRSPMYNFKRIITLLALGLIIGLAMVQGGPMWPITKTQQVSALAAMVYLAMDFIGILSMVTVLPITVRERTVYYRERAARMYGSNAFALSLFLVELPYLVVSAFIFTGLIFCLIGLPTPTFGPFLLVFFLYVSLCTFIGQLYALATPHEVMGQIFIGFTTVVFNLCSGYLVVYADVPAVVSWLFFISPSRYAYNFLASELLVPCDPEAGLWLGCQVITSNNRTVGDWALDTFDLEVNRAWTIDVPVLFGFWVLVIALTVATLKWVNWDTK
jgi:hypothetical protein